jgi:hypothetical protein
LHHLRSAASFAAMRLGAIVILAALIGIARASGPRR